MTFNSILNSNESIDWLKFSIDLNLKSSNNLIKYEFQSFVFSIEEWLSFETIGSLVTPWRDLQGTGMSSFDCRKQWNNELFGQNLPFNITNHRLLAIKFTIFLAIPFSLPFIIVRYQMIKASGGGGGGGKAKSGGGEAPKETPKAKKWRLLSIH